MNKGKRIKRSAYSALRFSFDCQLGLHRLLNDGESHILNNPSSNSF